MNYENINLNSNEYTKLSNEEKLKLVKSRIDSILNEKADKHQFTVIYKGKRIKINKDKQGSLRDLASRERSLEKRINDKKRQEELKKIELELSEKNEVEVTKEDNNKKNALIDNFKKTFLDSDYYKKLTIEDKIKVIKKEKQTTKAIYNYLAENSVFAFDDEQNKKYLEFLDNLLVELNKESVSNKVNYQNDVVKNSNEEKTNALIDNYRKIALDTDYYKNLSVEDKIKEINREKKSHSNLINEKLYPNDEESKKYIEFLDDLLVKLNVESISNKVNDKNNNLDKNTEEKKSKNKLFAALMSIPFIDKIKNKISQRKDNLWTKKFNKKKKRIAAAVCAGIIAVTGIVGLKSCNNNKDNNASVKTSITDIDDSKKQYTPEVSPEDNAEVEDNTISLNDTVTIDNGAPIYTNSYDASYNTNGYNALYDGSYDRIIEAVSYELNGNVYTVYRNEDNSYEKVEDLIKNGATLTSVLVTRVDLANDITHEGYYNANNVRVRSR